MSTDGKANAVGQSEDAKKIINTKRIIYIMRGMPGCGKTYWCRRTLEKELNLKKLFFEKNENASLAMSHILSADDYSIKHGKYYFNFDRLKENHRKNIMRTEGSMILNVGPLFIDNTNTRIWEFIPYIQLAKKYKYWIKIIEPETYNKDAFDLDKLVEINEKRDAINKNINKKILQEHINRYQKEYNFFNTPTNS